MWEVLVLAGCYAGLLVWCFGLLCAVHALEVYRES